MSVHARVSLGVGVAMGVMAGVVALLITGSVGLGLVWAGLNIPAPALTWFFGLLPD